jgi:hypothetical protein
VSVVPVLQAALGVTLVAAALGKVAGRTSPEEFLRGLGVAPPLAASVARALPVVELAVGLAVVLLPGRPAALAATLLGVGFAGVLALARARGLDRACRCFGALDTDASTPLALVRAVAVAVAAVALLAAGGGSGVPGPAALASGTLVAVAALVSLALAERVWVFEHRRARPPAPSRPAQEVVR